MAKKKISGKRLFVLDTNVLIHDPMSIYRFHEHDIYLPMIVLEELDSGKKGTSEFARSVRQINRLLDEIVADKDYEAIIKGISLTPSAFNYQTKSSQHWGHLFFQTHTLNAQLPHSMPGQKADNSILSTILALQKEKENTFITLVSKDINMRIKAGILGIHAEDYFNDQVLDDVNLLDTGLINLPNNFWDTHGKKMESWQENSRAFYKISGTEINHWHPNTCLYTNEASSFEAIVRKVEDKTAIIEYAKDYTQKKHAIWGITARNREQNFALNLLLDPDIDFVTLQGSAGSGKTLLTLAAGLAQTFEKNIYREIIITRVTVPLGEDIGFLPGTEEEKMVPWMGSLLDNLEVLHETQEGGNWGKAATNDLLNSRIKIRSLNFMRGRTFLNKYIIIDEAQNLTPKQMKTLITRAGPGTKIVCLGDLAQIDTPYLSETTSGLTYVIDRFKHCTFSGHITLHRGERSRLADYAANAL
ncbi:MAG: hypothetical protein LEGION0398_MBIBDBAK_00812 [Legionellaceae bacterium]